MKKEIRLLFTPVSTAAVRSCDLRKKSANICKDTHTDMVLILAGSSENNTQNLCKAFVYINSCLKKNFICCPSHMHNVSLVTI